MFAKWIKRFIYTVVLALCAIIVLRCCMSADRSTLTELYVTPELTEAYADGELEVWKLEENAKEIAQDGYFSAYGFRYIPECNQLQATVRYNVSVFGYTGLPQDTALRFLLCCEDDTATLRAPDYEEELSRSLYVYRKLVWNNVEIGDLNWQIYLDLEDGSYSVSPLRYAEQKYRNYRLTGAEKRALAP